LSRAEMLEVLAADTDGSSRWFEEEHRARRRTRSPTAPCSDHLVHTEPFCASCDGAG